MFVVRSSFIFGRVHVFDVSVFLLLPCVLLAVLVRAAATERAVAADVEEALFLHEEEGALGAQKSVNVIGILARKPGAHHDAAPHALDLLIQEQFCLSL